MADTSKVDTVMGSGAEPGILRRQNAGPSALVRLLDEWMQSDGDEQRETFEELRRLLDEDRPAGYKLFP